MNSSIKPHVLCVDDEPQVLESLKLNLRRTCLVSIAQSGVAALALLDHAPEIAVILSDMRMPTMNGAVFLAKARQTAPDAVRLLLTGQTDIDAAIAAVNDGQIFRFLTKPCAPEVLLDAVDAAVTQHRLLTSERVLLQQTLCGSIKALTEILGLVNPIAFGRTMRICKIVNELSDQVQLRERWQLEMAAMLSQIGHVTLPAKVAEKAYYGLPLSPEDDRLIERLPAIVNNLLAHIPRIEVVLGILQGYGRIATSPPNAPMLSAADELTRRNGAEILRLAIDYDILESACGVPFQSIIRTLRSRSNTYAPYLIEALEAIRSTSAESEPLKLELKDLSVGMVFAEDVMMPDGVLFVARGYQITERVLDRMTDLFSTKNSRLQWSVFK